MDEPQGQTMAAMLFGVLLPRVAKQMMSNAPEEHAPAPGPEEPKAKSQ